MPAPSSVLPAPAPAIVKFLPSYVGSKRFWLPALRHLTGRPFVELFAGSAVLSANLASTALLVDLDPVVCHVLSNFDEQKVPEVFTRADYYRVRFGTDWRNYLFCLQGMSYSGVFRYSDRGFNVPAKGGQYPTAPSVDEIRVRPAYLSALARWRALGATVRHGSYAEVTDAQIAALGTDVVVVLDPPYQGSRAAYNKPEANSIDYERYWSRVADLSSRFDLVLFDRESNLLQRGYPITATRKMRVNGARAGDIEAMSLVPRTSG